MLFNSLGFLIFFSVFFFVYWSVSGNKKVRNLLLLAGGMYLYSLWDIRFFLMLCFIIGLNYSSGLLVSKDTIRGKWIFYSALALNLLPLIYFKYYNFFIENIGTMSSLLGMEFSLQTMKLLLPVGISFYTFLSISYLIDVFRKQIDPEKNIIDLALSLSYFPIIMSGPIHRPRIFLKQIKEKKRFDYSLAAEGLRQMLTGLIYKVVIADNIAKYADEVFRDYNSFDGATLLLGSVYFSFQLYFDFNGYSEMAIGISKLLGFRINRNFKYPYLSRTISDFWKRWHISLTGWFRDYIFLPVSYIASRKIKTDSIFDKDIFVYSAGIAITWTLTGLWHGAGWNFIFWGMIHAVLLISNKAFSKSKKKIIKRIGFKKNGLPVIVCESLLTFILVDFAWIFFRSETALKGYEICAGILDLSCWKIPQISLKPLFLIVPVMIFEYFQKEKEFLFDISALNIMLRWFVYITATVAVIYYSGNDSTFIYMGF